MTQGNNFYDVLIWIVYTTEAEYGLYGTCKRPVKIALSQVSPNKQYYDIHALMYLSLVYIYYKFYRD